MNYILMDIKKFLKKLETGQMEIEAGQWELHKDITNLKGSIQELNDLKNDLQQVKQHGLKQTGLIKELQLKLSALERIQEEGRPLSHSELDEAYGKMVKKLTMEEPVSKSNKKKKGHIIKSEEILEIMSETSSKSDTSEEWRPKSEKNAIMIKEPKQRGQGDSSHPFKKTHSQIISPKLHSPHRNHNILQRYLEDAAKYIDREMSQTSSSSEDSCPERSKKMVSGTTKKHFRPDKSREPLTNLTLGKQNQKEIGNLLKNKKAVYFVSDKLACAVCPKKFACRSDFLKHEKKHQRHKPLYHCQICHKGFSCNNHLNKHEALHQKISKSSKGFRCSYCNKICISPEKLTAHMKNCRIITKVHCHRQGMI